MANTNPRIIEIPQFEMARINSAQVSGVIGVSFFSNQQAVNGRNIAVNKLAKQQPYI
jgi:hypothetical protein